MMFRMLIIAVALLSGIAAGAEVRHLRSHSSTTGTGTGGASPATTACVKCAEGFKKTKDGCPLLARILVAEEAGGKTMADDDEAAKALLKKQGASCESCYVAAEAACHAVWTASAKCIKCAEGFKTNGGCPLMVSLGQDAPSGPDEAALNKAKPASCDATCADKAEAVCKAAAAAPSSAQGGGGVVDTMSAAAAKAKKALQDALGSNGASGAREAPALVLALVSVTVVGIAAAALE